MDHQGNSPRRNLACPMLAAMFILTFSACVHARTTPDDAVLPVSELGIVDPDPSSPGDTAAFCNPSGKQGAELSKCQAQNDALDKQFEEEAKSREQWFNFAPGSWEQAPELEPLYVRQVAKVDDAVKKLDQVSVVSLNPAEAKTLGVDATVKGRQPYLVRALKVAAAGQFMVFTKDLSVFVRYDASTVAQHGEERTALVVYLPFKPKDVYVDCQTAE